MGVSWPWLLVAVDRGVRSLTVARRAQRAVRTSGENLLVVLLVMAPPSQELEPPAIPGRFRPNPKPSNKSLVIRKISPSLNVPTPASYSGDHASQCCHY